MATKTKSTTKLVVACSSWRDTKPVKGQDYPVTTRQVLGYAIETPKGVLSGTFERPMNASAGNSQYTPNRGALAAVLHVISKVIPADNARDRKSWPARSELTLTIMTDRWEAAEQLNGFNESNRDMVLAVDRHAKTYSSTRYDSGNPNTSPLMYHAQELAKDAIANPDAPHATNFLTAEEFQVIRDELAAATVQQADLTEAAF